MTAANTMSWGMTGGIALGVGCGMLAVAGSQHLFGPIRRRALGVVEVAAATLGFLALLAPALVAVAAVFFGVLAVAFLVHLTWLFRTDRNQSCECTPFSTAVTALSFVPSSMLLAAALGGVASARAGVGGANVERVLFFSLSACLGWAALLWPSAAER